MKARYVFIELNIPGNEENLACFVSYMVSFDALRVTHENCLTYMRAEFGLQFGRDMSPASGTKDPYVRKVRFVTVNHFEGHLPWW